MLHAFTAGAWNPVLMKAGFAAMVTDGTDDDGMTAEGSLDCEKAADATRAEMVALQGIGLVMKLMDEGDCALVHATDPDVPKRAADILERSAHGRLIGDGIEFADYFDDGAFLKFADQDETDPLVQKCLAKVRRMADGKAGLVPPAESNGNTDDGIDPEERCPVCGGYIDQDDIDVNNNTEDGYGEMKVPHMCPHCGAGLYAYYDAQDGYAFLRFETE